MSEAIETPTQGAPAENNAKEPRTFTQEEFEAELGKRVFRERNKYADYDELKAKAAEYDQLQEASKSELQKAVEERDKLKTRLDRLEAEVKRAEVVAKAASEHGVSAELLSRMSGDVDENAAFLKEQMANVQKYGAVADFGETSKPPVTRESIEAIADPVERVRARAQHLDLYQ